MSQRKEAPHLRRTCHAKLLQLCLTLCDPMDSSPPDSSFHRILQARILECVTLPSSRESSIPRDQTHISYVSCIGQRVLITSANWEAQEVDAVFIFRD